MVPTMASACARVGLSMLVVGALPIKDVEILRLRGRGTPLPAGIETTDVDELLQALFPVAEFMLTAMRSSDEVERRLA